MKRVSVDLDVKTVSALDQIARRCGQSRSWLIRIVLDAVPKAFEREFTDNTAR
ncbi:ribbon-helix-helix domain-containing protein [Chloroflexota bacterium]